MRANSSPSLRVRKPSWGNNRRLDSQRLHWPGRLNTMLNIGTGLAVFHSAFRWRDKTRRRPQFFFGAGRQGGSPHYPYQPRPKCEARQMRLAGCLWSNSSGQVVGPGINSWGVFETGRALFLPLMLSATKCVRGSPSSKS